jgi:hypothetical protein
MASYVKFNQFVGDLAGKVHDLLGTAGSTADTCKVMLTNTAPVAATNAVKADLTDISAGNGYTAGGTSTGNVGAASSGTVTVTGTNVTWTASGGTIGPFRYVALYNDTPTSPADPLIAYWDYGSNLTLQDGDSFTVKFNNGASSGTIFTLA